MKALKDILVTPFSLLMEVCGLSSKEASTLFKVPHGVVKSWDNGKSIAPAEVLGELRWLHGQIVEAAGNQEREIVRDLAQYSPDGLPQFIEIGYPANDVEAQAMGMPCVGAWRARAALLVARLDVPVRLIRYRK